MKHRKKLTVVLCADRLFSGSCEPEHLDLIDTCLETGGQRLVAGSQRGATRVAVPCDLRLRAQRLISAHASFPAHTSRAIARLARREESQGVKVLWTLRDRGECNGRGKRPRSRTQTKTRCGRFRRALILQRGVRGR